MIKIVMISAKQGGGKTALANELIRAFKTAQFDFAGVYKFAGPLYALHDTVLNKMETLTGIPRVEKDGDLLQVLGTEWGHIKYGDDIWASILKKEINKLSPAYYREGGKTSPTRRLIIIDDCRFANEFNIFPEAYRVRLEAPEDVRKVRATSWRENVNHPSEVGLDEYAAEGRFDLRVWTDPSDINYVPVGGIASLIYAELQRNNWREGRGF